MRRANAKRWTTIEPQPAHRTHLTCEQGRCKRQPNMFRKAIYATSVSPTNAASSGAIGPYQGTSHYRARFAISFHPQGHAAEIACIRTPPPIGVQHSRRRSVCNKACVLTMLMVKLPVAVWKMPLVETTQTAQLEHAASPTS